MVSRTTDAALLELTSGNSEVITVNVIDENGIAVDLSTVTALVFCVKEDPESDTDLEAVVNKDIYAAQIAGNLTAGVIIITLEEADTSGVAAGSYYWDLRIVRPSLTPKNFPSPPGKIIFNQPVRRG